MDIRKNWLAILLAITSVTLIGIGLFQLYAYSQMRAFIACQADYNQKSSIARDARIGVTDKETDLLFNALRDNITAAQRIQQLPPDQRQAEADRLQDHLIREFHLAVQAHDDRLQSAKDNPYPPNPETTCGTY